jgi:hypothetical protein
MTALFKIDQVALPPGTHGQSRADLQPFSVGGPITLQAQDLTHADYLWEIISSPADGVAPVLVPVGATCTFLQDERGGYLLRLTVDSGLSSEDVSILYAGVALSNSALPIPAGFETNQDNIPDPHDGSQGWWYKLERWIKWADASIGSSGGFAWWDVVETTADLTLDGTHNGKTIVVNTGAPPPLKMGGGGGGGGPVVITLPPVQEEYWVRVQQGTGIPGVQTSGSDIIYKPGIVPAVSTTQIWPSGRSGIPQGFIEFVGTPFGWLIWGGDGAWVDAVDSTVRYVLGGNVTDNNTPVYGSFSLAEFDIHGQLASSGTTTGDFLGASYVGYTFVVKALNMLSDEPMKGSPPALPLIGDAYVVNTWGGGYTDGDVVVWDGANWTAVATLADAERLRVVVSGTTPGVVAGGSFFGCDKQVMEYRDGAWYTIMAPQLPGMIATLALVVKDPVYSPVTGGVLYSYGWESNGAGFIWYAVGSSANRADIFASFSDVRDQATPGGPGTSGTWMARMLTDDTELNTGSGQITLQKFGITGLDVKTFKVAGDKSAHFIPGRYVSVRGSTGNDREGAGDATSPYTIDTVTYNAGPDDTSIVVLEALLDANVDGYLYTGRIVVTPGTYEFDVVAENCGSNSSACRLAEATGITYTAGYVTALGAKVSQQGSSSYSANGSTTNNHSHLHGCFQTTVVAEYWEVHQYVEDDDTNSDNLLGLPVEFGMNEHYCRITLRRIGEGSLPH